MRFYFLFIIHLIYSQTELNYGQLFQFQSQSLGERTYRISLPESYSQSSVSYPVVYLLDANFYFLDAVSTIRFLSASGTIPELIVIGIDSKNRRQEMTPPGFSLPDVSNGSADKFLSFLSGELIPEIEKKYRCNPLRILAGHSHAALFANYAFTTSKHAFRWYLLLDPPAHLESYKIETVSLDYLRSQKEPGRLFVYENTFGWSDENWNAALKITSSVKLHREKITNESHETMTHLGFYKGFKDLFADFKYTHGKELSLNKLKKRYDQLSYEYGYPVDIPASIILLNAQDQIFMAQPDLAKELIDAYEQQHGKTNQSGRLQFQLADLIANPPTETRSEILNSPQPEAKQMQPFLGDWQGKVQDHFPYEVVVHLTTGNSGFTGWIKIGRPDGQEGEETKLIYIRRIDETTIEFGYENLKRPFSALNAFRAQIRNGEMTGETSFIGIKVPPAMAGNDFSRTFKLKRINSN